MARLQGKQLRLDKGGIMVHVPIIIMVAFVLLVMGVIGWLAHTNNFGQDFGLGSLFSYSWALIALGVVIIVYKVQPDLRIVGAAGAIAAAAWYVAVMMP
jgi:hypothetical protein